jgi:hypothetical protein
MAGHNTSQAAPLLQQLPSANYNSLTLLLEAARRVADGSAVNSMTSAAIAAELVPCMMWHPPVPKKVPIPLVPRHSVSCTDSQRIMEFVTLNASK